jgi:hypothetical protein
VIPDKAVAEVSPADFDAIVLPGGRAADLIGADAAIVRLVERRSHSLCAHRFCLCREFKQRSARRVHKSERLCEPASQEVVAQALECFHG